MTSEGFDEAWLVIAVDDPAVDDICRLLERHIAFTNETSPAEDRHALDLPGLLDPAVTLFSARSADDLLGIAALKELDYAHAELKSMHIAVAVRGRGIGRAMLHHLLGVARQRGHRRLSLETGSMDGFAPARALYASAGFLPCRPFADYPNSPNSAFFSLSLD